MTMTSKFKLGVCAALLLMFAAVSAHAQLVSGARTITLNANLSESISVNLSANGVKFVLTAGSATNNGAPAVTATTFWIMRNASRTVSLYAYFASASSALSDGFGDNIPSANFSISDNGGAYAPLVNTVAFGGANAGLQLFTNKITGQTKTGNHTDNMQFNIDLSTLPNLPAGIYTGTLVIQAQAI